MCQEPQLQICTCSSPVHQQVLKTVIYGNKKLIFQAFILLLTEISVETNPQVNLDNTIQCSLSRVMDTLWGLPAFFMMPDGRPYTQCSALSIMSCTLIPKLLVGTGCVVQMKVARHCSDCCFNWSLEPRPSLSMLHSKPHFSFQLLFLLPSSRGVLILLPSAVRVGTNVYKQKSPFCLPAS